MKDSLVFSIEVFEDRMLIRGTLPLFVATDFIDFAKRLGFNSMSSDFTPHERMTMAVAKFIK